MRGKDVRFKTETQLTEKNFLCHYFLCLVSKKCGLSNFIFVKQLLL